MSKSNRMAAMAVSVVALIGAAGCCKSGGSESSSSSGKAGEIGVAECDEYIRVMNECYLPKMPAAGKPQFEQGLKTTQESWKQMASNPITKAGLPQACKQALDAQKPALDQFGCKANK
jgi:hypothetical protein